MTTTAPNTGYTPINGLSMYYEIHGAGQPLILLNGGFGLTGMFGEVSADYNSFCSPALALSVTPFLDAPMPAA